MIPKDSAAVPQTLELRDYMRAIGHDVGAPIRHIRGFSALLDDEIGDSLKGESRLLLDQIQSSAELAESMIYGLHDLAYLGSRLALTPDTSLREVVENAAKQVGESELTLVIDGDARARTDQRLLARMIANFMRNTLAYADEPHMAVTIAQHHSSAMLTLTDRGPAFDQREWLKLLQPFKRLHERPKARAVGLGLTEAEHIANLLDIQMAATATPGKSLAIELLFPPG